MNIKGLVGGLSHKGVDRISGFEFFFKGSEETA